jgi:hypothetical protein
MVMNSHHLSIGQNHDGQVEAAEEQLAGIVHAQEQRAVVAEGPVRVAAHLVAVVFVAVSAVRLDSCFADCYFDPARHKGDLVQQAEATNRSHPHSLLHHKRYHRKGSQWTLEAQMAVEAA